MQYKLNSICTALQVKLMEKTPILTHLGVFFNCKKKEEKSYNF